MEELNNICYEWIKSENIKCSKEEFEKVNKEFLKYLLLNTEVEGTICYTDKTKEAINFQLYQIAKLEFNESTN